MIHHRVYVRRKNRVSVIVHRHRRIRPPEEGLGQIGVIIKLPFDFYVRFSRIQRNRRHSLCPVHLIRLAHINRTGTVGIFRQRIVNRGIGGGPVVLRPVKLNTPGNPRPGKPYKSRFNHMIVIDKIIPVGFVISPLDSSSQLGKNHHFQIFVFQIYRLVGHVLFFIGYLFRHRQRIYLSGTPLISPLFNKQGTFFRRTYRVSGNDAGLLPDFNAVFAFHKSSPFPPSQINRLYMLNFRCILVSY